jgi:hypothetical protein
MEDAESRVSIVLGGFQFDICYRSLNLKESITKHKWLSGWCGGWGEGEAPVHAIGTSAETAGKLARLLRKVFYCHNRQTALEKRQSYKYYRRYLRL